MTDEPQAKPSLKQRFSTMDKRLRLMLISTGLLLISQIGQFIAIRDMNTTGQYGDLAVLFQFAGIFLVPTAAILTGTITWVVRKDWRRHERILILGLINALIILNLVWFWVDHCSWAQVFGLALKTCS